MATSKATPSAVLDTLLAKIATANQMLVCSGASNPADRASALAAALASSAMTTGLGNGDYTAADDGSSGRKVTMTAKSGVSVTATGSATCVVLIDGSNIIYITTVTAQTLTSGNTVNIPSWIIDIAAPV